MHKPQTCKCTITSVKSRQFTNLQEQSVKNKMNDHCPDYKSINTKQTAEAELMTIAINTQIAKIKAIAAM